MKAFVPEVLTGGFGPRHWPPEVVAALLEFDAMVIWFSTRCSRDEVLFWMTFYDALSGEFYLEHAKCRVDGLENLEQ